MDHNQFKVIVTGRYKKDIDMAVAAERIAKNSEITPPQAITLMQSRQEKVLQTRVEHVKAYGIKRSLQDVGVEIRLEPARIFFAATENKTEQTPRQKKTWIQKIFSFKRSKAKKSHNQKQSTPTDTINWQPASQRPVKIQYNHKNPRYSSFSNAIVLLIFAAGFWYLYNNYHTQAEVHAYDEDGKPIVMVFTSSQCGAICDAVVREIKARKVPAEYIKIDQLDQHDKNYRIWETLAQGKLPLIIAGQEKVTNSSKQQLVSLLGINFGDRYLSYFEKPIYAKHFNADGSAAIAIYGASWCGPCTLLKKQLKDDGIPYTYIDVDQLNNKQAVLSSMEIRGYPAVWIGYKRLKGIKFGSVKSAYNKI
jgi:glutaredoxin